MVIGKGKAKRSVETKEKTPLHEQAGLTLSTARIKKILQKSFTGKSYSKKGLIFLTGCLEYMTEELLDASSAQTINSKRTTINNRHIWEALKEDSELKKVFCNGKSFLKEGGFNNFNVPAPKKKKKEDKDGYKSSSMPI